ncbi:MAG TPA: aspartate--tRNA ligase [Eubacteriales bacterium]|nr:aspartate--tRNA ligase [Clostridia bacterium]HRV72887.1 aspartate--tRNA ligase [Eubacteriales bacterium]
MDELLRGWKRSCYCAEIDKMTLGESVTLMGWVKVRRDLGAMIFMQLRDRSGLMQVVFDSSALSKEAFDLASTIRSEYVLAVRGTFEHRAEGMVNTKMPTGEYELMVSEFKILAKSDTPPIDVDDNCNASELLRLKYRYLDLRRPCMQNYLLMRNKITDIVHRYFSEQGFIEIETPMLTVSTPEGARDYLVPSRVHPGEFYALPQSPQQFKQLLMLSGFDRYVQIARCFRDEDLRADRQPDFTQIDLEMSFVEEDDVIAANEGFLKMLFWETLNVDVQLPLPRIKWIDAMNRYGSDKPDTRFGMELHDLTEAVRGTDFALLKDAIDNGGSVRCITVKGGAGHISRKEIDALGEFVKTYKAKALLWMNLKPEGVQSSLVKRLSPEQTAEIVRIAEAETGDLVFIVADKDEVVWASLGALRLKLGDKLGLIDKNKYNLLWVVEFPLLEWSEEENRFMAMHHPFTSPMDEDLPLLDSDRGKVRAKAYDIVLNGVEIGGGSIRIHSQAMQTKMFEMLGFTKEQAFARFGYLLEAFRYGTPPHGGLAYGLDRLAMLICGTQSIRDVIAFPKVQNASCPLTNAPATVDEKQLKELHIKVTE